MTKRLLIICALIFVFPGISGAVSAELPSPLDARVAEARAQLRSGDALGAAAKLEVLVSSNPEREDVYALWAISLAKSGNSEGAREAASQGLVKHPQSQILAKTLSALGPPETVAEEVSTRKLPESERKAPLPEPKPGTSSEIHPRTENRAASLLLSGGAGRPRGLFIKSLLLPGWGQLAAGHKKRAAFIGVPALALLGGAIWAGWAQRREVHAYDGAVNTSLALEHAQRAQELRSLASSLGTAGGTLWLFGILDASLSPGTPSVRVGVRF